MAGGGSARWFYKKLSGLSILIALFRVGAVVLLARRRSADVQLPETVAVVAFAATQLGFGYLILISQAAAASAVLARDVSSAPILRRTLSPLRASLTHICFLVCGVVPQTQVLSR